MPDYPRKLIEVALPLEAINKASAREKSIRHGHPSTLHLWWARRPLAAARAVIFAQMVDDPSAHPELFPTEEAQEVERQRLFRLIEELVKWENTTNEAVLGQAREEIWRSWRATCAANQDHPRAAELFDPKKLPAFHDPFAGGGSLPLEAQRLGLEAHASDLNPVAVLINKAMIEIPPKFAGRPPVNPEARAEQRLMQKSWRGAQGLAEDVRYYGKWMRDEAEKRIGHLYPKVAITAEMARERPDLKPLVGRKLTVIAWLWARTVKSPNPAFAQVDIPLASGFILATKPGKESYVEPVIGLDSYRFTVKIGKPKDAEATRSGTKLARGANFRCLMSGAPITPDYIKAEGKAGRMGARLMAIVAEGERGRVYLSPTDDMEAIARAAEPTWRPETPLPDDPRNFWTLGYGLSEFASIFTPRQLVALTTLSNSVHEARDRVRLDAHTARLLDDCIRHPQGGATTADYADAVAAYLGLAVARYSNAASTICSWNPGKAKEDIRFTFSRQALPMTWDFAEGNLFSNSSGNFADNIETWVYKSLAFLPASGCGVARQADATVHSTMDKVIVSTDPPYYDNISYADLSDYFYIWLRCSLRTVLPELFSTMAVPKAEELVASPYRHDGKVQAETFFMNGMSQAMRQLLEQTHPAFPITVYYAFKQSETGDHGVTSTGWETFLGAVIQAGFALTGTWPVRTEREGRSIGIGTNALASSIVLVCRPRNVDAPTATRREFLNALETELPEALALLQHSNIAPVDLAQAAIGPGMAIYTRYARVLDAEGQPLSVHQALILINQMLDEVLAEQESDFDADTRWALAWFEQFGFAEGEYGVAETLSKAKNTSVAGMVGAHILTSRAGRVRLLPPAELPIGWDPTTDPRLTVWETVHQLIRRLEAAGEGAAAELVAKLGSKAEVARELAYRLYTLCERKKRAAEALSYNGLVQSWPEISRLASERPSEASAQQATLL